MPRFVFEDYVNAQDKNADGSVIYNVDTSYATHLVSKDIRKNKIFGTPWGWPGTLLEFHSTLYSWWKTANFTELSGVNIHSARGPMKIYSTNNWTGNGKWRNGKPDATGIEVPASSCPQLDFTDSSGITFTGGISVNGQPLLGPINIPPTTIPGGGWLFTITEAAKKNPITGSIYFDGTGAPNTSNNCTLTDCAAQGMWNFAGMLFCNSVIHNIHEGGVGLFGPNTSSARAFAATRSPLGNYQSPFYPNVPNLTEGERRMCYTPVGVGALVLDGFEIHSMIKDTFPSPGNSNLAAPILLDRVTQFDVRGKPLGSDGLAIIEIQKYARLLSFSGVEFWNADRYNNSQPGSILFLNNTAYSVDGSTEPVQGISFTDCVMNGAYLGLVRGVNNSAISGLYIPPNNYTRPDVPILDLSIGYTAGTASTPLTNSTIYCKGASLSVGGSLPSNVRLADPGVVTVQGVDNARRI